MKKHFRKALQDKTVQEIYEAVRGIVSDTQSVNKGLAAEISRQLGLEWTPGRLYCWIHTVLECQEGMKKTWLRNQEKIGYDKMYPSIAGFELDMEDKSLIKQNSQMFPTVNCGSLGGQKLEQICCLLQVCWGLEQFQPWARTPWKKIRWLWKVLRHWHLLHWNVGGLHQC